MIALVTIGAALIALAEYLDTIPHAAGDVAEGALAFSADGRTASLAAAPQPADWPLPFAVSFQPWPACLAALTHNPLARDPSAAPGSAFPCLR